ncbi:MAG: alpha/beta hydrolase [Pseudomonadota bacterium]
MSGFEAIFLESTTGANVRTYVCETNLAPKGVVHINHGMSEHAARYERFANDLADKGYHTVAHDHRGHGETTASDAPLGSFATSEGWKQVLADVQATNSYIKERFTTLPVCVFGHSMGATIAASFVLNYPEKADAAAIWNGAVTGLLPNLLAKLLLVERMLKGSDVPSTWADALTFQAWNREFKPLRTQSDWLSRDPVEVDKYIADPLCGFSANIGLWLDLLQGSNDLADMNKISNLNKDMPVHLLAGAADPCSNKGGSVEQFSARLEKAGLTDVTKKILPDTRHESLNEINRDDTTANFIQWLDGRFG